MVSEDNSDSLQTNSGKFWTLEEHDLLLRLKEAGESWQEISEKLERTPRACQNQYKQRFVVFPGSKASLRAKLNKPWTDEENKLLLELKKAGRTWKEISESMGRTPGACRSHYFEKRFQVSETETSQGSLQLENEEEWTAEEEKSLFQLKASDKTWPEIANRLPGRTDLDCQRRYEERFDAYGTEMPQGSLQAKLNKLKPWTEEEDKLLLTLKEAGVKKWQEISESLGRTSYACQSRYGKCIEKVSETEKLKNEGFKWTAEEEKLLVQLKASDKTWQEISERLERTPSACQARHSHRRKFQDVSETGSLQLKNERRKWTAEEEKLLFQLRAADKTWQEISDHLPGRTVNSCMNHCGDVLRRGWSHEEENKLARLYERFKPEMWSKIGQELKKPWEEAEEMHWRLGAEGMAKRAGVANLTLAPPEPDQAAYEQFVNDSGSAMSQDELIACIAEQLDETVSQPNNDSENSNEQHES
ncbi:hypothetical protein E4U14_003453 [Claviceps sp. LM454 group G7]|nr:hypothetical protein E4U14_003453 [Claviceps sp. LM454 group G7]